MFGSEVLEVAIGLALLFLFLSPICTAIAEAVEGVLKHRAMDLERGIRELLDDRDGSAIAATFFAHPLVYGLYMGDYRTAGLKVTRGFVDSLRESLGGGAPRAGAVAQDGRASVPPMHMGFWARRSLPSYIPAGNFSGALLDIVARGAVDPAAPPPLGAPSVESLRAGALALPGLRLQRAVLAALDESRGDLARAKTSLEAWYDSTMDRVSGWYKRRTQRVLFVVGFALAGILNIDAVTVARRLGEDKALRQAAVAQAGQMTGTDSRAASVGFEDLARRIEIIGYPMGWSPKPQSRCKPGSGGTGPGPRSAPECEAVSFATGVAMAGGWLISALAVMLGAPFWFDLLNKSMVIRATVKPREKSPEEESEDRQAPARVRGVETAAAPAGGDRGTDGASPGGASGQAPAPPRVPFEPHHWKDGREEGIL